MDRSVKNCLFTNNGLSGDKICHVDIARMPARMDISSGIHPHELISAITQISKEKFKFEVNGESGGLKGACFEDLFNLF